MEEIPVQKIHKILHGIEEEDYEGVIMLKSWSIGGLITGLIVLTLFLRAVRNKFLKPGKVTDSIRSSLRETLRKIVQDYLVAQGWANTDGTPWEEEEDDRAV